MLEATAVSRASPIVMSRGTLNDGKRRLALPVVWGRCAHDALPHTFDIGVFKIRQKRLLPRQ